MYRIPKPIRENYALTQFGSVWKARVLEQIGPRWCTRWLPLGKCEEGGIAQAREERDRLFERLLSEGRAVRMGSREDLLRDPTRHIYRRAPFYVRIGSKHLGDFHDMKTAREARDNYLFGSGTPEEPDPVSDDFEP